MQNLLKSISHYPRLRGETSYTSVLMLFAVSGDGSIAYFVRQESCYLITAKSQNAFFFLETGSATVWHLIGLLQPVPRNTLSTRVPRRDKGWSIYHSTALLMVFPISSNGSIVIFFLGKKELLHGQQQSHSN